MTDLADAVAGPATLTRSPDAGAPLVRRAHADPIVAFGTLDGYGPLFNAGLLHHDGRYHLFVRAVRDIYRANPGDGPRFLDYVSDIAVFVSDDATHWCYSYLLARAGEFGVDCFEDPRVHVVAGRQREHIVMTYTNLSATPGEPWRVGVHELVYDGERFHLDPMSGRVLGPDGVHDKDAIVFNLADGRVALIHRIHPNMQLALFDDVDHLLDADQAYWDDHLAELDAHVILRPADGSLGIGAGAPPIETARGLLLFFHERNRHGVYTMNLALLDAHSGRPLAVLPEPVLVPELEWEIAGDVDNVVFVQGAHLLDDGDTILLVYGAADRHVGAATASASHLLDLLHSR